MKPSKKLNGTGEFCQGEILSIRARTDHSITRLLNGNRAIYLACLILSIS